MNKVLELIPEIFYDILARIIPGSFILIISLVFISYKANFDSNTLSNYLFGSLENKISNCDLVTSNITNNINIRAIPETLIILVWIIISYFIAIILNSFWHGLGMVKNWIINNSDYEAREEEYSRRFKFPRPEDKINYPHLEFLPSDVLQLQITKLGAEKNGIQTILMSLLVFLVIQIVIEFTEPKNNWKQMVMNDWIPIAIISSVFILLLMFRNNIRDCQEAIIRKQNSMNRLIILSERLAQ